MKSVDDAAARARVLYELGCNFSKHLRLDELVPLVIAECRQVLDAEGASLLLLDAARKELYFPFVADEDSAVAQRLRHVRFPAGQGIAGAVVQSGVAVRVDDVSRDPRFNEEIDRRSGFSTRSLLCVPLRNAEQVIGVLQVVNRRGGGLFSDSDVEFLAALGGSIAIALDNARLYTELAAANSELQQRIAQLLAIRHELEMAAAIQQSILPRQFPPHAAAAGFDLHAEILPARDVGGDFYDVFAIDADRLGLVIADVSGKGMPAAIFMTMSRTILKATALHGLAPAECLRQVNRLLCGDNPLEMFVSVFYGILDTRSGELHYSNGGHNAPLLRRAGGVVEALRSDLGMVLGLFEAAVYGEDTIELQPGDALLLYTDGVSEAADAQGALFSETRLGELLGRAEVGSARAMLGQTIAQVQQFAAGAEQSDDITLLGVRRR